MPCALRLAACWAHEMPAALPPQLWQSTMSVGLAQCPESQNHRQPRTTNSRSYSPSVTWAGVTASFSLFIHSCYLIPNKRYFDLSPLTGVVNGLTISLLFGIPPPLFFLDNINGAFMVMFSSIFMIFLMLRFPSWNFRVVTCVFYETSDIHCHIRWANLYSKQPCVRAPSLCPCPTMHSWELELVIFKLRGP